jgi:Tfp pilus assembly protein PilX
MLKGLTRRIRRPRDDRGSLIIAISVILVLTLVCAAIVAEVAGNQQNVVYRQNAANSVAGANAGLSDALFRIDQGSTAEGSGTEFYVTPTCSTGLDSRCVGNSVSAAANVTYKATQVNATKWTLQSESTTRKSVSAVGETVSRTAQYPFALFGNQGLNFDGTAPQAFGTYTSNNISSTTNPDTSAADCTNGTGLSCVAIGSNGTIACNGGIGSNVTSVYYSGGGGISGSCGTPSPISTVYNLTIPGNPTGAYFGCPNGGQLGSNQTVASGLTVPGVNAPLPAGTYLCSNQEVVINGNMSVSGSVTIDIILDSATNTAMVNAGTPTLDITAYSYVNVSTAITTDPPPANQQLPDATLLTIQSNSTGTVGDSNGHGYWYGGVLNAPNASLVGDGCKSVYFGAAVINTLTCNGGPHLSVYYDSLLSNIYGPWQTSGYQQINPSSVTIP